MKQSEPPKLIRIDGSHVNFKEPNSSATKEVKENKPTNEVEEDADSNNCSSSNSEEEDELTSSGEKFEIVFDPKMFEVPQIIKTNFNRLEVIAKA